MISRKHKCIFIHIPKCAGAAVEKYLMRHAKSPPYDEITWRTNILRQKGLAQAINLYPEYFTFTFVRNPFDRFVSYYLFGLWLKRRNNLPYAYRNFRECIDLTAELLDAEKTVQVEPNRKFGVLQTESKGLKYERYHVKRQVDFLLDGHPKVYFGVRRFNDAPCSFIGRYESLERDFFQVTDLLGIPRHPLLPWNVSGERFLDNGKKRHYSTYFDKTTRRLVEDLYAEDLEALGYEFEDEDSVAVPVPLTITETARARRKEGTKLLRRRWSEIYARRVGFFTPRFFRYFSRKIFCALKWRFKKYLLGIDPPQTRE